MSSGNLNSNQSASSMANILHQSKKDYDSINNALLKNIEILDNENSQLKSALTEMQIENKEKDQSIDASQKLITKLKEEYTKLFKEFQGIEWENNEIRKENEMNQKNLNDYNKNNQIYEKSIKRCDALQSENEQLRAEIKDIKLKLKTQGNSTNIKDKDIKDKDTVITDLKEKTKDWLTMIKQRELTIQELNKKIQEWSDNITQKDEQLKVMVNFSKEINNENKTNVAELTKQAVKTIKIFYNTLNNSNKEQNDNANRIEFKNTATTFADFDPIFKDNKGPIMLEDAINGMMYIPTNLKSWSKEFIMDMNLKTEWIKSELYSGLVRESTMISFLEDVFVKLNFKDSESIKNWCSKIIILKTMYEDTMKENSELRKNNMLLLKHKNEFDLYTKKMKDEVRSNLERMKEKFDTVERGISAQLANANEENKMIKERCKRDWDKLKTEIWNLRGDKQKKEKENWALRKVIEDNKWNQKMMLSFGSWNQLNMPMNIESWTVLPRQGGKISYRSGNRGRDEINQSFHSVSSIVNDSFNEQNYRNKKKEITDWKEELSKMKSEMANIISNPNNNNDNQPKQIVDEEFIKSLEKEKLKNKSWEDELNKLSNYCNDLEAKLSNNKHNNQLNKPHFFPHQQKLQFTFSPNLFIKMFYDINGKIFSSSELKKFYSIYKCATIDGIIDLFNKKCEKIKRQIYETHFDIDTSYTDLEESLVNSMNANMNNSYKIVNDRIVRLKKFEFDFVNLNEFTKNYLIAQEIVVKKAFSGNDVIHFEPIEHLYKWFEDCLNYKIDDMSDNIIFTRKMLLRMIKNQKQCLGLSLECQIVES